MNRKVKRAAPVVAKCLSCEWSASGSTWRPIRRALKAHTAERHPKVLV